MPRRYARWKDGVGCAIAGLWPIALTLAVLGSPGRYNPYAVYSGLGAVPFRDLPSLPTTDPNIYATSYTLGVRSATLLVHGHLPWWNTFEGLGQPLAGELQSGGLFPFTPLLLLHDGSLIFHLVLLALAGVATYWLLREFKCNPLIAAVGGMLFATNGTFAWLANAASNPVCFLPIMLLGVERARRTSAEGRGGGWRWLAIGTAFALAAGFIEVAALGMVFVAVIAIQRGFVLRTEFRWAYARKVVAGLLAGVAIAAPVLVAFQSFVANGFLGTHSVTAKGSLPSSYLSMTVAPYFYGRIGASADPAIHALWGAVGGYAGFALLALGVASLFGRRERPLRIVLASWVALSLAVSLGLPGLKQVVNALPVTEHIVLFRYLPPTWELALVLLAAFALRDLATAARNTSVIALTTGVLSSAIVLLLGVALDPHAVDATRALTATSFHQSELLVVAAAAGLLLAALAPSRFRTACVGVVVVAEAAILFAIPLASWPHDDHVDNAAVHFLTNRTGTARFYALGPPEANFGSQVGVRQLNVVDLPVPTSFVPIVRSLDPFASPTIFTGERKGLPGTLSPASLARRRVQRLEYLGVRFVVAPADDHLYQGVAGTTLVYSDHTVQIWQLAAPSLLASAPHCTVTATTTDSYALDCARPSLLLRTELWFPGWSASVNGTATAVTDHGVLQAVRVPRGTSTVALTYLPPNVPAATLATLVALLSLCVPWTLVLAWNSRRRARRAEAAGLATLEAALASRAALGDGDPTDPPTGAVPTPGAEDDPATSAVPVVVVGAGADDLDGPPTSSVAAQPADRRSPEDPPTISVPSQRRDPTPEP